MVLVVVAAMIGVSVSVVEIVHVVAVLDGLVAAALTMDVLMISLLVLLVLFGRSHRAVSLHAGRRFPQFAIYELRRVPTPPPRSPLPAERHASARRHQTNRGRRRRPVER